MKSGLYILVILFRMLCPDPISGQTNRISHELYTRILKKYVDTKGNVDYAGLKADQGILHNYLGLLSKNPPSTGWTQAEQLAYWINVYNANTLSLVAKHYPVNSIKDIRPGIPFINSVWDIKFINIGAETYDLNNIEHGILRKKFDEPRIHFAINCASFSCPKLLNEAYTADKLEMQLTTAAKGFLADPGKNKITADHIELSKIFDWFGGDFKKKGNLIDFLNKYAPLKINSKAKINYLDYNWTLNKQ